jgi:ABC-type polysaccharide/polyol phosphate transport system ATPase subunit
MNLIESMSDIIVHLHLGQATVYENVQRGIAAYQEVGGER